MAGPSPRDVIDLRDPDDEQVVHLEVGARVDHLRLVRLVTTGVAANLGFDLMSLEELRVAVDEIAAAAMAVADSGARLRLRIQGKADTVSVEGAVDGDQRLDTDAWALDPVAAELLALFADASSMDAIDGCIAFRLTKRARRVPGAPEPGTEGRA